MVQLLGIIIAFFAAIPQAHAQAYIDQLDVGNVKLLGNTISTTNTNGDLIIDLNGSGKLQLPDLSASTVPYLDSTKKLTSSLVTPTELGRLSGVTSSLCGISDSCTVTNKTLSGSSNTFSNLPYSALTLSGSIVNADVSSSAAIAYSKLALTGSILNADLAGSIADSKLSTISTAGKVSNSATTATSSNTNSAIVARDSSGNFTASTITANLTGNVTGNLTGNVTGNTSGSAGSFTGALSGDVTGTQSATTVGKINGTSLAGLGTGILKNTTATGVPSIAVAADFPTLNQTTSGNAANVTGTVAIANGGTGKTTKAQAFNALSCMTAAGSIMYGGASGACTELLKGSDTQVLTLASGVPTWATAGGGSSVTWTVTASKTANYTTAIGEFVPASSSGGAFTVTLPTAASQSGNRIAIKKTDSTFNAVTIATTSAQTIDGVSSTTLNTQNETLYVISDGSNWLILDRVIPSKWTSYTPTYTGFGTVSTSGIYWRRTGPSIELRGNFQTGTAAASIGSFSLPSGLAIDSASVTASTTAQAGDGVGSYYTNGVSSSLGALVTAYTTSTSLIYFGATSGPNSANNGLVPQNGNILNSSSAVSLRALVPISGWN